MAKINMRFRPSAKKNGSKSPTSATRSELEANDQAMPGGRYPIPNVDFLKRAIRSIGRTPASKRPAVVAWIKKRAAALGQEQLTANLSNAADRALELANEMDAVELAQIVTSPELTPGARGKKASKGGVPAIPDKGSGASKKPAQSGPVNIPLKTRKGKALYVGLRKKGWDHKTALKACQKAEQGMEVDEMSNTHDLSRPLPPSFKAHQFKAKAKPAVPAGDTPGKKDADGDFDNDTAADVQAKKKLGLQNKQALDTYRKAIKRGLPPKVAIQAAKMVDKKLGNPHTRAEEEMANSPKA